MPDGSRAHLTHAVLNCFDPEQDEMGILSRILLVTIILQSSVSLLQYYRVIF